MRYSLTRHLATTGMFSKIQLCLRCSVESVFMKKLFIRNLQQIDFFAFENFLILSCRKHPIFRGKRHFKEKLPFFTLCTTNLPPFAVLKNSRTYLGNLRNAINSMELYGNLL